MRCVTDRSFWYTEPSHIRFCGWVATELPEVHVAFEVLPEEIEQVANAVHESGAAALKSGRYDEAREAIEYATRLAEFRECVKSP